MIWVVNASLLLMVLLYAIWLHKVPLVTSDGAIVMAFGILIVGALQQWSAVAHLIAPYLVALLLAVLLWLVLGFVTEAVQGTFAQRHLQNPLGSFATGTWVAALSVAAVSILRILPQLRDVAVVLFVSGSMLWLGYVVLVVRNYKRFFQQPEISRQAHGILLLSCVSTQSLVVVGSGLFGAAFPQTVAQVLLGMGMAFYLVGLVFIAVRYWKRQTQEQAVDWPNTNCIIHGAMSITVLASAASQALPADLVAAMWLWVLLAFLFVEVVEIVRACFRVRRFGWKQGLFTYASSQWARNFTFGMLYACTRSLPLEQSFLAGAPFWEGLRSAMLAGGCYLVLFLFVLESLLFVQKLAKELRKEWQPA